MNYEKMRKSGKMNMFEYGDREVLTNYDKLFKHFVEDEKEEDYKL